jgi:phosphoglycolate phosphatase
VVGHSDGNLADALRRFKRAYYRRLPQTLVSHQGRVLPGVLDLLEQLKVEDRATLSLGTGNFRNSAGIKLRHYGLYDYFHKPGGFGDRTGHRPTLVAHGIAAANRTFGKHRTVFVIGDTVHDIAAAKANGVVAVGVATGSASADELAAAGADLVLPTLEAADGLLRS